MIKKRGMRALSTLAAPFIFFPGIFFSGGSRLLAQESPRREAASQVETETETAKAEAEAAMPPKLEYGVELRWRNEFRDNADFQPTDDFDHFLGQRIRIHLRYRLRPDLSFYIQGQDVELADADNDKIIHDQATNLHQAYFEWRPQGSKQWTVQGGRQELSYGKQRLVGAFAWDNVGRAFDGVRVKFKSGDWSVDGFGVRLVGIRRRGAPSRAADMDLYGAYLTRAKKDSPGKIEFYGLFLRDGLLTTGEVTGIPIVAETTRIATFGFRRIYQPKQGFRYEVESAWQFGERGPDQHRAAALAAGGGYAWSGKYKPSLVFEYDFATGDEAPSGRSREFHNLFPTNHLHYGYADLFGWRNIHDFRLTGTAQVHPKLGFQFDYHKLLLAEPSGAWKNAGGRVLGRDPFGLSGRDVGQEIDLTFRAPAVFPFFKQLSLMGGYSVFFPGGFARATRGPETHHFGYIQTTVRF